MNDVPIKAHGEGGVPRKRSVGGPRRAAFLPRGGVVVTGEVIVTGGVIVTEGATVTDGEIMSSETRTAGGLKDGEKER
jgi:hypothetical protein